ncbi:hypothetical protein [Pseudomonas fluorescens]|uniref:Uncharacterized protein n=1 Tax=Pseudomonas fluorescens TaxID=294 RepID=A0A5E7U581_PSEFL|nr:hypothetical protein [Pseudomonas fluorescens]VVQ05118.1 hypothetical protein PS928_02969 [Pseudomonas fluorescens]
MSNAPSTEHEAPVDKITPLNRSAVAFHESRNNTWSAVVPAGTTKERLLQSGLWSVVSDTFHSFDRINVIWADRSGYADLLVVDAGRGFCNVILLNYHQLPALLVSEAGLPPGFECYFDGPINNGDGGYCVKRIADGVLLVRGKPNRDAALAELLDSATLR